MIKCVIKGSFDKALKENTPVLILGYITVGSLKFQVGEKYLTPISYIQ